MKNKLQNPITSASIMCLNWLNLESDLQQLNSLPLDKIHIDIIDGKFAKNFTFGEDIISAIRSEIKLPAEYHLMVNEPSGFYDFFSFQPGDMVTIHVEASSQIHRDLVELKQRDLEVGVALNPGTSVGSLEFILEEVDSVTLMTVNPGFAGQSFIPAVVKKVPEIMEMAAKIGKEILISVDGNININTAPQLYQKGARSFVLGTSGLFLKNTSLADAYDMFIQSLLNTEGMDV